MYYIERIPITDNLFLSGSIAEPSPRETVWTPGVWAVGAEAIRPELHRVFRCAVARTAADTQPPEQDVEAWADMRSTERYTPLGPLQRADGKLVYESRALSVSEDIEYRLRLRYVNAVALFGLAGGAWSVDVYDKPVADGGTLRASRGGVIKMPAAGYWDYAYGQRTRRDRVLISGLPIFPAAEVVIKVTASADQLRAVSQIEIGKLRFIPGVQWGGTEYGLRRSPRAYSYRKEEPDGSSTTLLYGSTYDMSGRVVMSSQGEDQALIQLRALLGKGTAFAPTLGRGYEQSLVFGTLEAGDTARESFAHSTIDFQIRGLPT